MLILKTRFGFYQLDNVQQVDFVTRPSLDWDCEMKDMTRVYMSLDGCEKGLSIYESEELAESVAAAMSANILSELISAKSCECDVILDLEDEFLRIEKMVKEAAANEDG